MAPKVKTILKKRLGLDFHDGKLKITSIWHGIEFLGAWLKPHRVYASRNCVGRISKKLDVLEKEHPEKWFAPLNSYCGLLSHGNNYNLRQQLLMNDRSFERFGAFDYGIKHYYLSLFLF